MTSSKLDEGAVESKTCFSDSIRRCFRRSVSLLYCSTLLQALSTWRRTLVKNVCYMVSLVVSYAEGALEKNAGKEGLLVSPYP